MHAPWLKLGPPGTEPSTVFVSAEAAASMDQIAMDVYRAQGSEWGGVTFGRLWDIDGSSLVLIEHATRGVCADASGGRVEILPEILGPRRRGDPTRRRYPRHPHWHMAQPPKDDGYAVRRNGSSGVAGLRQPAALRRDHRQSLSADGS